MRQKDRERIERLERELGYLVEDLAKSNQERAGSNRALFEAVTRCMRKNPETARGQRVIFLSGRVVRLGRLDAIEGVDNISYLVMTEDGMWWANDVYVIDP